MRHREYSERRGILKRIKNRSRYVTGRIHSHRRPVEVPASMESNDSPACRGLTELTDETSAAAGR
jgi:hypothetical protein